MEVVCNQPPRAMLTLKWLYLGVKIKRDLIMFQQTTSRTREEGRQTPAPPTCSILSCTSGRAIVTGASSMIFWWRRCMEQSRPNREMALPYLSANSCTSRWRAFLASFITKIGEPGTSAWTWREREGQG